MGGSIAGEDREGGREGKGRGWVAVETGEREGEKNEKYSRMIFFFPPQTHSLPPPK